MRATRLVVILFLLCLSVLPNAAQTGETRGGSILPMDSSNSFIHFTMPSTVDENLTRIVQDHANLTSPLTDNNVGALLFTTHRVGGSAFAQPTGVYYIGGLWYIFNQIPSVNMPTDVRFNMQVVGRSNTAFTHLSTPTSTFFNETLIDHPLLNNDPSAMVIVTPSWNGIYHPQNIGVYYSGNGWSIFNQNSSVEMLDGLLFNVQVVKDPNTGFSHTASALNNVSGNKTRLDNAYLNNSPFAKIIVTSKWTGTYNDNPIGVEYFDGYWHIVNTNGAAMPNGASFNILIADAGFSSYEEYIVNGGFEATITNRNSAVGWNTLNAGAGSKRVCNKYIPASPVNREYTLQGECAYMLRGAGDGTTRKIVQNRQITVAAGSTNTIDIQALVKGAAVAGGRIRVTVTLTDGTLLNYQITPAQLNGTYDWTPFRTYVNYPTSNPPVRIKTQIMVRGGTLFVDGVSSVTYITTLR